MSKAKPEPRALPKRFYREVSVVPEGAGFCILLDGRPIRTPAKQLLQVPVQQLAGAIAEEWRAQQEVIDTDTMPLTRLANIALDRMADDRAALLAEMAGYATTDLLCYRAPEAVLQQMQVQHFDPVLAWAEAQHAIRLTLTEGVMPVAQPADSVARVEGCFAAASDAELAALALLLPILGSAVLTLAVWHGFRTIDDALVTARLDEAFQAEQWGEDAETRAAWDAKCRDARAAAFFLDMQRTQKAA